MASTLTLGVLNLLVNPEVRSVAKGHVEPFMFDEEWAARFVACLSQGKYDGVVPDMNELVLELHTRYKVPKGECELAAQVMIDYRPPRAMDEAVEHVQSWVQSNHLSRSI